MNKGYKYSIEYNEPDKRKQEHIYISSDGTVYSNSLEPTGYLLFTALESADSGIVTRVWGIRNDSMTHHLIFQF